MSTNPQAPKSPGPQPSSENERSQHSAPSTSHPADRDDILETQAVDSPEQDVLTLDEDDYRPQPVAPPQPTP